MDDTDKTNQQLIDELTALRLRVADLEKIEAERQQAEEELRQSEARYRILFEGINDPIFVHDKEGRILEINQAASRRLGYTQEEFLQMNVTDIDTPEFARGFGERLERQFAEGGLSDIPIVHIGKDGRRIAVDVNTKVIDYQGQRVVLSVCRDVTERKRVEEALRESENRTRATFNAISDAVFLHPLLDEGFAPFVDVNDTACERYGYSREEFLTLTAPDITKKEDADAHATPTHRRQLGEAGRMVFEATHVTRSGQEIPVEINSSVIELAGRPMILAVVRDIAERNQAEAALRRSEERLRLFADASIEAMHILDKELNILFINKVALDVLMQDVPEINSEDDVIGQNLLHIYPFLKEQDMGNRFLDVLETGVPLTAEITAPHSLLGELHLETRAFKVGTGLGVVVRDVTEQERSEQALRENEARYRSLFDDSPISLWEQDFSAVKAFIDGLRDHGVSDFDAYFQAHPEAVRECMSLVKQVDLNQATLALHGAQTKLDLLVGLGRFLPEESLAVFREELVALADGATVVVRENVNRTLAGDMIYCVVSISVPPGFEETWGKVFVSVIDISERRQVEEALRESESRYRSLFEDSPISLWEQDFSAVKRYLDDLRDDGVSDIDAYFQAHPEAVRECVAMVKLVHVNQATLVLYDAENTEELLTGLDHYLSDESLAVFREELVAMANGETLVVRENVNRTLKGETINCVISISIPPGFEETWEKVFVSIIDVTESKQAEEALRKSEERYRTISELVSDYAYSFQINPDGTPTVEWITEAFAQITGYTPEELEQLGWEYLRHPDDTAIARRRYQRHMAGETTETEYRLITKDGDVRWVRDYTRPTWDAVEQRTVRLVGSTKDVTASKQLEEETRKADILRVELEKEKEIVALKERIISTVSHEFRTPLTIIQTSSDLLVRYFDRLEEERRRQLLEQVNEQIAHLTDLIDDVLTLSRAQAGKTEFNPSALHLESFCRDIFDKIQFADNDGHRFEFISNPPPKPLLVDGKLLHHVLVNLLSNATKFSPEQTTVRLELDSNSIMVIFRVSDEGIGIPEDDLGRLFEPFHRADNVGHTEGTGLGLSISKHYVELHGGTISVESKLGQGSTFTVSLPIR